MLTQPQQDFVNRAIARKKLFWALSLLGIGIGLGLALWFWFQRAQNPEFDLGYPLVLVVLVLLNARQNLRQYKFALALETLLDSER
jgi:hypothetical protein